MGIFEAYLLKKRQQFHTPANHTCKPHELLPTRRGSGSILVSSPTDSSNFEI